MQQFRGRSLWQLTRAERRPWQHRAACLENVHRECAQVDKRNEISKPLFKVMACLIVMLCWLSIGTGPLNAQIDRGTIVGLVTDPLGAIVPGAKIQVTNVNTDTSIALEANELGLYTVSKLPRGNYLGGKARGTWSGKLKPATDKNLNSAAFAAPAALLSGTLNSTTVGFADLRMGRKRLSFPRASPFTSG